MTDIAITNVIPLHPNTVYVYDENDLPDPENGIIRPDPCLIYRVMKTVELTNNLSGGPGGVTFISSPDTPPFVSYKNVYVEGMVSFSWSDPFVVKGEIYKL